MKKNNIYFTEKISDLQYKKIVIDAVRYAIISLPFTIDRMRKKDEEKRALNIAKGKIAEGLFKYFCKTNNLNVDFESCETPFWKIDNRDFMYQDYEWDLKNNFIYCENQCEDSILNLPALIPNKNTKDQWSTRNEKKITRSKGVKYLFTFLKGAGLENGKRNDYFIEIAFSNRQKHILKDLYIKYKGLPAKEKPFDTDKFWSYFLEDNKTIFKLNAKPQLIITGVADNDNWELFKDTGPYSKENYIDFVTPFWYQKVGRKDSLKWLNGTMWTTITNKTLAVSLLKPFAIE